MMALASDIAGLNDPVPAKLTLHVDHVLRRVRGFVIQGVDVSVRRRYLRYRAAASGYGVTVEQVRHADSAPVLTRRLSDSSRDIARHVEHRIANILVVENAEAGPDHELRIGRIRDTDAGSEVRVLSIHQRLGILAVAANGRGRSLRPGHAGRVGPVDGEPLIGV